MHSLVPSPSFEGLGTRLIHAEILVELQTLNITQFFSLQEVVNSTGSNITTTSPCVSDWIIVHPFDNAWL